MSDSARPHRRQPTRLPCPWDSLGRNAGVDWHFLLQCVKVKSLSRVRLFVTPRTAAYQAPPSMGFSRQEYWSGVPLHHSISWIKKVGGQVKDYCISVCEHQQEPKQSSGRKNRSEGTDGRIALKEIIVQHSNHSAYH